MTFFKSIAKGLNGNAMGATNPNELETIKVFENSLEKGHIAECFGHSSFGSQVTGSQIKEGFEKVLKYVSTNKKEALKCMQAWEKKAGVSPTERPSDYAMKGLGSQFEIVPKMYSSKAINECIKGSNGEMNYSNCPMVEYNKCARDYIECSIDECYANAIITSVKGGNSYYLSLKQTAILGTGK